MYHKIDQIIDKIDFDSISNERKTELEILIQFIQSKRNNEARILLNFICTHNSRRSQLSQVWAKVASEFYGIKISSYSGGTEATAFNERAIESLERFGFQIKQDGAVNPKYSINWKEGSEGVVAYSKRYDDAENPTQDFAAIMTCSHADENCPFVLGCEKRIPIRYQDPKFYDDTPLESAFYDYRSFEIASEMFYVFSKIK